MNKLLMATIVRANDSKVYASGSVLSSMNQDGNSAGQYFTSVFDMGGQGKISKIGQVRLFSTGSNPLPAMEAWILTNPIARDHKQADGDQFKIKARDLAFLAAVVPLNQRFVGQAGSNCVLQSDMGEICVPTCFNLNAILVFRGTYSPKPSEEFYLQINQIDD